MHLCVVIKICKFKMTFYLPTNSVPSSPGIRIKCQQLTFLRTTDLHVHMASYKCIDIYTKCVISHSYYMFMNWLSCRGVNESVVELQARRLPSDRDGISKFVSVTLDYYYWYCWYLWYLIIKYCVLMWKKEINIKFWHIQIDLLPFVHGSGVWSTWSGWPVGWCHGQRSSQGLLHSIPALPLRSVFLSRTAKILWAPYPKVNPISCPSISHNHKI